MLELHTISPWLGRLTTTDPKPTAPHLKMNYFVQKWLVSQMNIVMAIEKNPGGRFRAMS